VGLGLKGEEFKTARKHLTANLSGNSAWRYNQGGPRRQRAQAEAPAPQPAVGALSTIYLENRNDNHSKFYRIEWNGRLAVRTVWGRIGTEGRSKEESFEGEAAMQAYIEQTLQTRLRHSYTVVSDTRQSS